jgi:hypothetical protein
MTTCDDIADTFGAIGTFGTLFFLVFYDEQLLARLDKAELAAGHFFDGRWILAQPTCLVSEPRVFSPGLGQRGFDRREIAACLDEGQEPFFADDCVNDEDNGDKGQDVANNATAAVGETRCPLGWLRRVGYGLVSHSVRSVRTFRR